MKRLNLFVGFFVIFMLCGCPLPPAELTLCDKDEADFEAGCVGNFEATMTYYESAPAFDFEVTGTVPVADENYTLIYYPDPWPGSGLICLASAGAVGNDIDLSGTVVLGHDLPIPGDENAGAKIWLVPDADLNCEDPTEMVGWNPANYLFENDMITYTFVAP
jgi:hypothetical protein